MIDNCIQITEKLLFSLDIKYTSKYLKESILSHPHYPSLLAISDTLKTYNIENIALKIDLEQLKAMPTPSIVQMEINKIPSFAILHHMDNGQVAYYNDKNQLIEENFDRFSKQWTGICLFTEATDKSMETDIEKKLLEKRVLNILKWGMVILSLGWIIGNFINSNTTNNPYNAIYIGSFAVLKLLGLGLGISLLWYDLDKYNATLQKFCSSNSQKVNCDAVLSSKYAQIFKGTLNLSLIAFSYFFGSSLYLFLTHFSEIALSALGVLSITTFPLVVVSIYYQAFIIKHWCKFCIAIQGVLLLEIAVAYFGAFYKPILPITTLYLLLILLLIPIPTWKFIKPLLLKEKKLLFYKRGLKKMKTNPNVLNSLLLQSRKINTSPRGLGITIKNNSTKYNIIKVCNPYCPPCARAHPILEDLVKAGKISLQIIFITPPSDDSRRKITNHLLAIHEEGSTNRTQQALDDWYNAERKDYEIFALKHPVNSNLDLQHTKINSMNAWCEQENIVQTPTIFINGHELPKEYNIDDLPDIL